MAKDRQHKTMEHLYNDFKKEQPTLEEALTVPNIYTAFGAFIGDICGSKYEFDNLPVGQHPEYFTGCWVTDDSIHTLATMWACSYVQRYYNKNVDYELYLDELHIAMRKALRKLYRYYPQMSYGDKFRQWCRGRDIRPYGSFGNGAAMRVSPVAYIAETEQQCLDFAKAVTTVTHNTDEAVYYAQMVALSVWYALHGKGDLIGAHWRDEHFPDYKSLVGNYSFDETCAGTVPVAMSAFLASSNFLDCLNKSIEVGGDSDTIAAIACSIASAKYKVPYTVGKTCTKFLDGIMRKIVQEFYRYSNFHYMKRVSNLLFEV